MQFPFIKGDGIRREEPADLPKSERLKLLDPEHYLPDPGLIDAVNVALLLGQPLLLTGEPGTGKTQLASYVAWELGLDIPLVFETKSTSTAGSIFYSYDALRRFQDAQSNIRHETALPYITYNALGKAILYSWKPEDQLEGTDGENIALSSYLPGGFNHPGKRRSVVLIDEIDKAPQDVPNDILNEIDQMFFRVPELDNRRIYADENLHPIVILTSNSDKDLPPAFLRRCIYYHIEFPEKPRMTQILLKRMKSLEGISNEFAADALDLFYDLRNKGLYKDPATAELLDWISALRGAGKGLRNPLAEQPELVKTTLGALIKNAADRKPAHDMVDQWLEKRTAKS